MKEFLQKLMRKIGLSRSSRLEQRHAMVGPSGLWRMKREFQITFLTSMGLEKSHTLLDIGCGTLRGGLPLISYLDKGNYFGTDVRADALEEGRKELRESGLEHKSPTLLLAPDISVLSIDRAFDFIWAFSVLIHMSDQVLDDALAFVSRHLAPGGVFYANVNIGERAEGNWQGFPVVWRTMDFYTDRCQKSGLVVSDIGTLREHGHLSGDTAQDNQRVLRISKNA